MKGQAALELVADYRSLTLLISHGKDVRPAMDTRCSTPKSGREQSENIPHRLLI